MTSQIVELDSDTKALQICGPNGAEVRMGAMADGYVFMQHDGTTFITHAIDNPDLYRYMLCFPQFQTRGNTSQTSHSLAFLQSVHRRTKDWCEKLSKGQDAVFPTSFINFVELHLQKEKPIISGLQKYLGSRCHPSVTPFREYDLLNVLRRILRSSVGCHLPRNWFGV